MNKERRLLLMEANKLIDKAYDLLSKIKDDEEMVFDNLTEGLQATVRGSQMEDNIYNLNDAIDKIDEVKDLLSSVD